MNALTTSRQTDTANARRTGVPFLLNQLFFIFALFYFIQEDLDRVYFAYFPVIRSIIISLPNRHRMLVNLAVDL